MSLLKKITDLNLIKKAFWGTLIVMTVSELTSSVAIMIDGIILTRFIGGYAIAAHGLTIPYTNLIKLIGGFFAAGSQIVCSRKIGKCDLDGANRFFSFEFGIAMLLTVFIGAVVSTASGMCAVAFGAGKDMVNLFQPTSEYLTGLGIGLPFTVGTMIMIPVVALNGDRKRVAFAAQSMMLVNIAGDLLNVFVFDGGMIGMALATSFSYFCSFIILLLHFRKRTGIMFNFRGLNITMFVDALKAGLLPSLTRACSFIKSYVINIVYLSLAGTAALAANSLIQSNVKVFFICIAAGLGQATLAMSSVLFAEEDKRGLKDMFSAAISISFGPCLIIGALVFAFAPYIISVFGAEEFSDLAVEALRVFITGFPLIGIKMFYIYYFQGSRNIIMSSLSSVLGEFVLITVSSLILIKCFGTFGLWLAYPVSEFIYLLIIFIICWVKCGHFPRSLEDLLMLPPDFDVAEENKMDYMIHSGEEAINMSETARQFCLEHGLSANKSFYVSLAVEEVAYNIFEHGADDGKTHFADLKIIWKDSMTKIRLRDNCRAFDPRKKEEMMPKDDITRGIGLRLLFGLEEKEKGIDLEYIYIFNLNNFVAEIKD